MVVRQEEAIVTIVANENTHKRSKKVTLVKGKGNVIIVACVRGVWIYQGPGGDGKQQQQPKKVLMTYPALAGRFEMSMLSGANAFTYDSVMAKYCGESSSSSIVIGAGVGGGGGVCIVVVVSTIKVVGNDNNQI